MKKKFSVDRLGSFRQFSANRPVSKSEDAFELLGLYFTILSNIASRMVVRVDEQKNMIVQNYIEEIHLKQVMTNLGLEGTKEIVLNSVLIPSGVRTRKSLTLKFAHRSFQEFFFARFINDQIRQKFDQGLPLNDLDVIYSDGVKRFLLGFLKMEWSDTQRGSLRYDIINQYRFCDEQSLAASILQELATSEA